MDVLVMDPGDTELLHDLADEWIASTTGAGVDVDRDICFREFEALLASGSGDGLVLMDGNEAVGLLGLEYTRLPYATNRVANEHFFFVRERYRGRGGLRLINAARKLARANGCDRLIMSASLLSSAEPERAAMFYEKLNFQPFEMSYIEVL